MTIAALRPITGNHFCEGDWVYNLTWGEVNQIKEIKVPTCNSWVNLAYTFKINGIDQETTECLNNPKLYRLATQKEVNDFLSKQPSIFKPGDLVYDLTSNELNVIESIVNGRVYFKNKFKTGWNCGPMDLINNPKLYRPATQKEVCDFFANQPSNFKDGPLDYYINKFTLSWDSVEYLKRVELKNWIKDWKLLFMHFLADQLNINTVKNLNSYFVIATIDDENYISNNQACYRPGTVTFNTDGACKKAIKLLGNDFLNSLK